MDVCPDCGAAVERTELHSQWHDSLTHVLEALGAEADVLACRVDALGDEVDAR